MIYEFLNFFSLSCRTMFLFSILREMPRAFQQVEKFLNAGKGRSGLHRILQLAPASVDDDEPSTLILQVVELSTLYHQLILVLIAALVTTTNENEAVLKSILGPTAKRETQ